MLTTVDYGAAAGISGVEWDAVELPSQFMEHFVYDWRVAQEISSHVDTGEKLPREFFDKVVAARTYHAG
jgi:oligopeptidase A